MRQRHLNQTLTYWAPGGTDIYGKPTSGAPTQIKCRWEDRAEQILGKGGIQIISKSRVFIEEPVNIDGYVFLGISAVADPSSLDDSREIQQLARQPDLRGLRSLTVIYL